MKKICFFLILTIARPVFSEEVPLSAVLEASREFMSSETCAQVLDRMRMGPVKDMSAEDQLKSIALHTFMIGFARGKDLSVEEAGSPIIDRCFRSPNSKYLEMVY